jgi:GTP pyrophosphokinase
LPGDPVIGFVTRGFGISVHKRDCPNAIAGSSDPSQEDRWLPAHWEKDTRAATYEASLALLAEDKIGVLAEVSAALAEMRVPVMTVNVAPPKNERAIIYLTVGCRDTEHYNSIVSRLRSIPTVLSVMRNADRKAFQ